MLRSLIAGLARPSFASARFTTVINSMGDKASGTVKWYDIYVCGTLSSDWRMPPSFGAKGAYNSQYHSPRCSLGSTVRKDMASLPQTVEARTCLCIR